ncbi:MAG: hypothetical protein AAGM22_30265 [Acidobacteriota bacterium]
MPRHPETPARPCSPPPRHKQALLTFVGLLGPVYFIPPVLVTLIPGPPAALIPLTVACIVGLMTYVIMPALQRLFGPWLAQSSSRASASRSSSRP